MKDKALNTSQYTIELSVGSQTERLPVIIRKHPRSRHMVIRYQPQQHFIALTLPRYVTIRQGLHFVEEKRNWIEAQIRERSSRVPFAHGHVIPLLGTHYTLHHTGGRGVIHIEEERIIVPGEEAFMQRRVHEWLKKTAKQEIMRIAFGKSAQTGKALGKISVRDTSSRWGSCSPDGSLSFSWRLIFAPASVLDYVVSHEVAHLSHHDHSPAFWKVTEFLCPDYKTAQAWLKAHGPSLHSFG